MHSPFTTRRRATAGASSGRLRGLRVRALPSIVLAIAAAMLLAPTIAAADTSSTLTVVGTSDVSDSGLIQNLIQPAFNAAYPQYSFKYIGSATGTAIQSAESGNGGPSALIVHAPSLENQFVAGGYSYNNYYGNAIFTNDFVLAGPTGDPAAVGANAGNDIARAFADVAAAGVAGKATFITRGGTNTASGTTVEEHALWALMANAQLTPSGVYLCNVTADDGGGMSPTTAAYDGKACPDSGTVTQADAPSWYLVNSGANQGANVVATNACTMTGAIANGCYSLTDRGTFDYLASGTSPTTNGIPNLKIVTQNNSASSPGGANELVNYFHVYIINPNSSGETVNLPAAQDFVSLLTSPAFQAQLPGYLSNVSPTPVFHPSASPALTAGWSTTSVGQGATVTVSGQVTNQQPGWATLGDQRVTVSELTGTVAVPVASTQTNATGSYSVTFTPPASGSYQVSTGAITVIENASLNPPYGDVLSPASTPAQAITVAAPPPASRDASVTIGKASAGVRTISVSGSLTPAARNAQATVTLLARPRTSKGGFTKVTRRTLAAGATAYSLTGVKPGGNWTIEVQYADPGALSTATSATRNVTVINRSNPIRFRRVSLRHRAHATISGSVAQAPRGSNATVKLLQRTGSGKHARFRQIAKATLMQGRATFTIKRTFKRGKHVLRLQYSHRGQRTTTSGDKTLTVK